MTVLKSTSGELEGGEARGCWESQHSHCNYAVTRKWLGCNRKWKKRVRLKTHVRHRMAFVVVDRRRWWRLSRGAASLVSKVVTPKPGHHRCVHTGQQPVFSTCKHVRLHVHVSEAQACRNREAKNEEPDFQALRLPLILHFSKRKNRKVFCL